MSWQAEVVVAAVVTGLVELVLHWFPWRLVRGDGLHQVGAYVLGVAGMGLPVLVVLFHWRAVHAGVDGAAMLFRVIWLLWGVVLAAGGSVAGGYFVDWLLVRNRQRDELQELLDEREIDG